jgi:hypothetical protein
MIDPEAPEWERQLLEAEGVPSLEDVDDDVDWEFSNRELDDVYQVRMARLNEKARMAESALRPTEHRPQWDIANPCTHCRVSPSRNKRKPGLCAACNQCWRRHGRLQTEDEIWLRVQRMDGLL